MIALEFQATLMPDGTLKVPEDIAAQLKDVSSFRVVVAVPENEQEDEEAAWRRLGMTEFFKGYAESDAIYDDL